MTALQRISTVRAESPTSRTPDANPLWACRTIAKINHMEVQPFRAHQRRWR
jgi:hypothetical protein